MQVRKTVEERFVCEKTLWGKKLRFLPLEFWNISIPVPSLSEEEWVLQCFQTEMLLGQKWRHSSRSGHLEHCGYFQGGFYYTATGEFWKAETYYQSRCSFTGKVAQQGAWNIDIFSLLSKALEPILSGPSH